MVIRVAISVTFMVLVYYRAPLNVEINQGLLRWLVVGLAGLAITLAWQVRSIMSSDAPRLRAAETIATGLPFLLLLYAAAYAVMSVDNPSSFTQRLGRTDALYFTMTVFTTIGFGDIAPATEIARIVTMTQMVVWLLSVGLVAKFLLGAVQVADERRAAEPRPTEQLGDR